MFINKSLENNILIFFFIGSIQNKHISTLKLTGAGHVFVVIV